MKLLIFMLLEHEGESMLFAHFVGVVFILVGDSIGKLFFVKDPSSDDFSVIVLVAG